MCEPNQKLRVWLTRQEDAELAELFGSAPLAYDVQILQPEATVGDYLQALQEFQARTLADCKGCDGCCHERAPLTIADWQLAQPAGQNEPGQTPGLTDEALAAWLLKWGELHFYGQAIDLTLPRTPAGACRFLDERQKCCAVHPQRSFTCRTHCCLPKTERAEALRAALINAGEDELVRRLLQIAPDKRPWADRLAGCRLEDYAPNAFSALPPADWPKARLQALLDAELWRELTA